IESFKITTAYGILIVPRDHVIKIQIGKNADKELKQKINELITQLGNKEFKLREEAFAKLLQIGGMALSELREAMNASDIEVKTRAEKLVRQIERELSPNAIDYPDDDIIQAHKYTIKGTVESDSFKIKTKYGVLTVFKKDIKQMVLGEETFISKEITLDGNFCAPSAMHNTGIIIKKGDRITITANGNVFIRNWGVNITPEGDTNYTSIPNFPGGALVGKIGQNGNLFKIGSKYNGKAEAEGNLFLGIAIRDRYTNTGNFKVKITVDKE
ncbi:MAG: hypothetical protein ABIH42_10535, partial [Planctomycetota bacterium]